MKGKLLIADVYAIGQTVWKLTRNVTSPLKQHMLYYDESSTPNLVWKMICSVWISQCIRRFIWISIHGELMTNMERWKWGFSQDMSCTFCGIIVEEIPYIFWDCPMAQQFWSRVWSPNSFRVFLSMDIITLFSRLQDFECILCFDSSSAYVLFLGL